MTTLVVGATGATGRHLVDQLLSKGEQVRAIVREVSRVPEQLRERQGLTLIEASVLDLSDTELDSVVGGCDALASCLGHNLTFKGMYGHPRRLVLDATQRLCEAAERTRGAGGSTRFVLMNTTGNRNRALGEPISLGQRVVVGLIRVLVPPHRDNELAADYLCERVGRGSSGIEWVVVRPDNLIDEDEVTPYDLHPSPTRSAIFDPGKTSRINVAAFMAELVTNDELWRTWQGQMPVIYNSELA